MIGQARQVGLPDPLARAAESGLDVGELDLRVAAFPREFGGGLKRLNPRSGDAGGEIGDLFQAVVATVWDFPSDVGASTTATSS